MDTLAIKTRSLAQVDVTVQSPNAGHSGARGTSQEQGQEAEIGWRRRKKTRCR